MPSAFQAIFAQSWQIPHYKSPSFFPRTLSVFMKEWFSWPTPGASESQPASLPVGHQPTFSNPTNNLVFASEKSPLCDHQNFEPEDTCGQILDRGPRQQAPGKNRDVKSSPVTAWAQIHLGRACFPWGDQEFSLPWYSKVKCLGLGEARGLNGHFLCWVFIHVSLWSSRLYK